LAGVGALLVAAHVLRTETDAAALEILDQVAQVRQRRQHHDVDAGHRQARGHAFEQLRGEGTAAMQLPVTGNDPATHRATPVERAARIADGARMWPRMSFAKASRERLQPRASHDSSRKQKLAAEAAPTGVTGSRELAGIPRSLLQLDLAQPL